MEPPTFPALRHALAAPDPGHPSTAAGQHAKLDDAAVKFEGMFVAYLLSEMRKVSAELAPDAADRQKPDDGLLDHAYRLVADDIAAQKSFGVANAIVAQLSPAHRG